MIEIIGLEDDLNGKSKLQLTKLSEEESKVKWQAMKN